MTSNSSKKAWLIALMLSTPLLSHAQQNGRTIINTFLQDWVGPIFLLVLVIGFLVGAARNLDLITDKHDEGTTLKGFLNVGKILLYILFIGAIITAIVAGGNYIISQLRV